MADTTAPTMPVSQRRRQCDWCGQAIERGERYARYRYFRDGDAGTCQMHPECYDAMIVEAKADPYLEWTPGDWERGARDQ